MAPTNLAPDRGATATNKTTINSFRNLTWIFADTCCLVLAVTRANKLRQNRLARKRRLTRASGPAHVEGPVGDAAALAHVGD